MKVEYIENGRFDKAIWIDTNNDDFLTRYTDQNALAVGKAMELWQGLTKALIKAGQEGTLDAGMQEYTSELNKPLLNLRLAAPALYEKLKEIDNASCHKCGRGDCEPWNCKPHMNMMTVILKAEGELDG